MRLYAGSSLNFIELNDNNQIASLLETEFFAQYGYKVQINEVMSWRNSLMRVARILDKAKLHDNGVFIEYQLPLSSKRIDIIVTGKDAQKARNSVIIELKQWDKCKLSDTESDKVVTWVGGGNREVLHPAVQVGNYKYYLENTCSAFYEGTDPIKLYACSYLHNYATTKDDAIFDARFDNATKRFPVYTVDDTEDLTNLLTNHLSAGQGMEVLSEIEGSKLRPSKKLLNEVSASIKNKLKQKGQFKVFGQHKTKEDYILIDNQLIVYDKIMSIVKNGLTNRHQYVLIVKGGAGTGKSVVALQLLADLTALGHNTHYATGSKSFTQTLRKIVGKEQSILFKYFNSYDTAQPKEVDVLILDEAHRIRETSASRYKKWSGLPQVGELINAAKILVFFIDDFQSVRKGEIGSSKFIKEYALAKGCKLYEYELEAQFRNGGSEGYANWVLNTLHINRTANMMWKDEPTFEFKIFDSPESLEQAIKQKEDEGYTARLTAGFCWEWSKSLDENGKLPMDVQIGTYKRPWNARPELTGLPKGTPKADFWAYEEGGIDQIGCIYTAQGFEFDYAGVIFGTDLRFNPDTSEWEAHPENSYDTMAKGSEEFIQLVKNTYRVLLSRGMKGCYVYFMDKETERFFRSRIEK